MSARSLLTATLAAFLTLFVWQTISNAALPWHMATLRAFADDTGAIKAIRAQAPENGVYASPRGVLAAISIAPDMADKTQTIGGMMAKQAIIDIVVALLLVLTAARLSVTTPVGVGFALGLGGLAAGIVKELSDANWYGFSVSYALVNTVDLAISFFLAGLAIGAILRRGRRAVAAAADSGSVRAATAL
jgi:hypothetical protein